MGKKGKKKTAQIEPGVNKRGAINYRHIFIIIGVGLILRILYDLQLSHSIFFNNYVLDSQVMNSWALDIINGRTVDLAYFRTPLYPYLLAAIYKIGGVSQWSVVIVQHLWGLITSLIAYKFASDIFGRRVGLWSGIVIAAFPTLIYFEGEVMITALATLLYTLAAYRLYLSVKTPSPRTVAWAGFTVGLAATARPTILPLLVLFPIIFLIGRRSAGLKKAIQLTVIMGIAALIPILPVTITNIVKGGEFVFLSTQGGVNFYIGNSRTADGISVLSPGPNVRFGPYQDNIWTSSMDEAKRRTGRNMSQSEISSFWYGEALKQMSEDIPRAIGLMAKKIYLFWHGQEIFNNKSLYYAGEYSLLMKILLWKHVLNFPSGLLFPLMFVGIYYAVRNKDRAVWMVVLFVIGYGLLVSAFFVCSRFRQPIIPLAITLATYGVYKLISLREKNHKVRLISFGLLAVLLVGLNFGGDVESKQNLSQFNTVLGNMYQREGDNARALPYFEEAHRLDPDNGGVIEMLGQAYLHTHAYALADQVYRKALSRFSVYPPFNTGMAQVFETKIGGTDSALYYFHRALNTAPEYVPAIEGLARLFMKSHSLDSALYYYDMLSRYLPPNRDLEMRKQKLRQQIAAEKNNGQ